jgi:hypothetical protein
MQRRRCNLLSEELSTVIRDSTSTWGIKLDKGVMTGIYDLFLRVGWRELLPGLKKTPSRSCPPVLDRATR